MRKPFIAGNMKMNKTAAEVVEYAKSFAELVKDVDDVDILICPNFTTLNQASEVLKGTNVNLGAQNMYFEKSGAFTGETSAEMLLDVGTQFVILGHSERRHVFGETNELINKKVKKALEIGLGPILCIGELLEEREKGITEKVCEEHIRKGFDGISKEDALKVTVAYEPVWAIGTGKTATPDDAEAVHKFCRNLLAEIYDQDTADKIRIQYGGSVKPSNVTDLMSQENIDGALVGGACLDPSTFAQVVKFKK